MNDTFLASRVLQERGFEAADIRVLLDARATAGAIRDRLEWLFDGADDGCERVLFYSGHGAQLPGYSAAESVDHVDECLVPYDFDWSLDRAITDNDFFRRYSELPFSARFSAILDCCHAGGMTRDGGPRIRGLTPPDDSPAVVALNAATAALSAYVDDAAQHVTEAIVGPQPALREAYRRFRRSDARGEDAAAALFGITLQGPVHDRAQSFVVTLRESGRYAEIGALMRADGLPSAEELSNPDAWCERVRNSPLA